MAEQDDDARVQEIREWATRALAEKSAADVPLAVVADTVFLLARLDALTAENETAWQTLARERDSWQAEANRLTAERDELLIVSRECRESMSRATTAMGSEHRRVSCVVPTPERPLFEQGVCEACNTLWPCEVARLQALLAERDAEVARLVEQVASLELDKRVIYAVLSRYSHAVQQTRWPKMDNSHWEAVIDLAHGRPILTLIAEARAALAARGDQR